MHTHTYIHTYIHTHAHTHVRAHTHTHTPQLHSGNLAHAHASICIVSTAQYY